MTDKNRNVPAIIAIGVLVLAAVLVGWQLGKSSKGTSNPYLPPISGTLDYYLSVNEQGDVLPYAPDGTPWVLCKPEQCGLEDFPKRDFDEANGYIEYYVAQKRGDEMATEERKAVSISLVEKAYAKSSDGNCPIIGYIKIGGSWLARYDPTDPDCPPH